MDIEIKPETLEELKKLSESLDSQIKQEQSFQYSELDDLVNNKKATNSPHEIIFDITATVLEENEKGEAVNAKEIMTKKFHIPFPIDKEYKKFMGIFFSHLEQSILDSTNKAYEIEDKE